MSKIPNDYFSQTLNEIRQLLQRLCNVLESPNSAELFSELTHKIGHLFTGAGLDREWYNTAEVAEMIGRRPYTIREACRLGRIKCKRANDRCGGVGSFRIHRDEVRKIIEDGLPPAPDR